MYWSLNLLLQIASSLKQWKNSENRLTFGKVIAKNKLPPFVGHHVVNYFYIYFISIFLYYLQIIFLGFPLKTDKSSNCQYSLLERLKLDALHNVLNVYFISLYVDQIHSGRSSTETSGRGEGRRKNHTCVEWDFMPLGGITVSLLAYT